MAVWGVPQGPEDVSPASQVIPLDLRDSKPQEIPTPLRWTDRLIRRLSGP